MSTKLPSGTEAKADIAAWGRVDWGCTQEWKDPWFVDLHEEGGFDEFILWFWQPSYINRPMSFKVKPFINLWNL